MLRTHMKRYAGYYLLAFLLLGSANVVYAWFPKVLGEFTDLLQRGALTREGVRDHAVRLMAIGIAYGVLFGAGQYINHRLGRYFEFSARERLFGHFTRLSEAYFSRNGIGKLLSYVMNDVTAVREAIANGLNQMTNASVLLVSTVAVMLFTDIPLYLLAFSMVPLLTIPLLVTRFGPRIRRQSEQVQEALAAMTESAEEQFGGIKVTKTFAAEPIARLRFGDTVERIRNNQLELVKLSAMFQAALPFAGAVSLGIAMTYGGILVVQDRLSLGEFVALTLYLRMIMNPLQQIGNVINIVQRSRASLDRLNGLFAVKPDIRECDTAAPLPPGAADVEIRGLTFAYPDSARPALADIRLRVEAGKTVGVVGMTGSGKSTLVKLLLRVYDPPAGTVFIGGCDIRGATFESLRTSIAYVPQDGFLFSTTIGDNIAFYERSADPKRVELAAKLADIYDNVAQFPDRFDTKLGERGLTLSGGQRQRTGLARGLIKDAPILILDDSVSAVDTVTETAIIDSLRRTRAGKTTILIAHRISAVMHADEIVVLHEGRVVERGTHGELLKRSGYYASLYAIQGEGASYG